VKPGQKIVKADLIKRAFFSFFSDNIYLVNGVLVQGSFYENLYPFRAKKRNEEHPPTVLIDLNASGKYFYGKLVRFIIFAFTINRTKS